ncbi:hypothetical protein M9H77_09509 [Catharanthus roseus]|uniref:Uncharacterized protein n=1 Tax=Catharanthus roseus TaxID=4058 RepID=A0ACC0C0T3_CATRO|nr:hypothetical protein M9H77_09509 [Catharanthus roseus]
MKKQFCKVLSEMFKRFGIFVEQLGERSKKATTRSRMKRNSHVLCSKDRIHNQPSIITPKKPKFRKQHRGRMKGIAHRGNPICFDKYALQALEPAWITSRQIEAGR